MANQPSVAVICPPEPEVEPLFENVLGDAAEVCFIHGADPAERERVLGESDAVVTESCAPSELSPFEASLLKPGVLLQLLFAGADNVPFSMLPENIVIASNAGAFAEPIAEHVLAMAFCLVKKIIPRNEALKRGVFDRSGFNGSLKGKICGILGFGGNGKAIARIMKSIGMKVAAVNRSGVTGEQIDTIWKKERIDDLLKVSDVLVLSVPLTRDTKGMIGSRELALMKPDAILVNVARGAVVDQDALYGHLCSHPDFGAATDTWWSEPAHHGKFFLEHPFLDLPNFIGSPHVADHVTGMVPVAARAALENVKNFLAGDPIHGVINKSDYI